MSRKRERGVALLAMLALIALVASYFLVSRLNAESGGVAAANRIRNAAVLNKAKQALIGYVAQKAVQATENNPGRLPCPEAPGNFGDPANEGTAAGNCSLPSVGRLPWRTLGLDKLVDAAGEPLWYVVSTGWALSNSTSPPLTTNINSNSAGQLTVNGMANDAVALIITPGPAFTVAAAAGCTAWNQVRPVSTVEIPVIPDWRNYLECENATNPADANFVTTGPSGSFNDQVIRVTAADVLPAIEAAIAHRIEREIVPVLKTVYTNTQWGAGISPATPMFPFAAPFANPGPGTGTSSFQGAAGTYQGLLPFNQTQGCTADPANPRCLPSLLQWSAAPAGPVEVLGYGYIQGTPSCTPPFSPTMSQWECTGEYHEDDATMPLPVEPWQPIRIEMTATFTNVAMGLRAIDATKMTVEARDDVALGPWQPQTVSYTATMNDGSIVGKPVGSVTITFGATLPNIDVMGWGTYAQFQIRLERAVISDHALLNPIDPPNQTPPGSCPVTGCTGWFVRNEWYRLLYYATSQSHTADQLPGALSCTAGTNCLTVTNMTPSNNKRSILILAGRSITGATRPNGTLSDFVEFDNADLNTTFEKQPVSKAIDAAAKKPFNDRIVAIDSN